MNEIIITKGKKEYIRKLAEYDIARNKYIALKKSLLTDEQREYRIKLENEYQRMKEGLDYYILRKDGTKTEKLTGYARAFKEASGKESLPRSLKGLTIREVMIKAEKCGYGADYGRFVAAVEGRK